MTKSFCHLTSYRDKFDCPYNLEHLELLRHWGPQSQLPGGPIPGTDIYMTLT